MTRLFCEDMRGNSFTVEIPEGSHVTYGPERYTLRIGSPIHWENILAVISNVRSFRDPSVNFVNDNRNCEQGKS
jgi:hypothetical protein